MGRKASVVVLLVAGLSVPGEQAAPIVAPCAATQASEAAAVVEAQRCGFEVAVTDLTTETTEVVAQPDGQLRATVGARAVRVRRDEKWVPVDLRLRERADGSVAPVADPFAVTLSGRRGASGVGRLASIGLGDDRMEIGWAGPLAKPVLAGNRATYPDALPGVDLVVEVTRKGVETFLVVKNRAAVDAVRSVSMPVTGAASHRRDAGGNIAFLASDGRVIATSPAPQMWDATTDPLATVGNAAGRHPVASAANRVGTGIAFTLTPDLAWLTAPERRFPVTIDPTINPVSVSFDTYVVEGGTVDRSGTDDLQLGRRGSTGPITRSFVRWTTSAFANTQVTGATTYFWNWYSSTCAGKGWEVWTTGAVSASTLWSSQPAWLDADPVAAGDQPESTSTATRGFDASCADGWVSVNTTRFFNRASMAGQGTATMGLRGSSETDYLYFKQFRSQHPDNADHVPYSVVTYNRLPTVTARSTVPASTCVVGSTRPSLATLTPTLTATVSDADATGSTVRFEWATLTSTTPVGSATVTSVANGGTAQAVVPAGSIPRAGSYRWRVLVSDATFTTTSSWCEVTLYEFALPAEGCAGTAENDYNGDGVSDVVIADPRATVAGQVDAGAVSVVDGASGAVSVLDESLAEVPGGAEVGDGFGHALASYDANRDGCTDLAVGVPFEDLTGGTDAGTVRILLGSPAGLAKGPAAVTMEQGVSGTPETAEAGDWFGWSLAAGKTAAGEPYLVVGAPGEDVGTVVDSGVVHYRRGSVNVVLDQSLSGFANGNEQDDRFGYSVSGAPSHFVVGRPGEGIGTSGFAGAATAFSHDLVSGKPRVVADINQDTAGVGHEAEPGDGFGMSVSVVQYRAAGTPAGTDSLLAVGAPSEDLTLNGAVVQDAGVLQRFHLTATGFTELPGISFGSEDGDHFGQRVLLVNTAPGAEATDQNLLLAVGVPGEDSESQLDTGVVRVFAAAANPGGSPVATIERGEASLGGDHIPQELIGLAVGANSRHLFVGSPNGDGSVWAIPWTSLATGSSAPERTYRAGEAGLPADVVAFGAVVR